MGKANREANRAARRAASKAGGAPSGRPSFGPVDRSAATRSAAPSQPLAHPGVARLSSRLLASVDESRSVVECARSLREASELLGDLEADAVAGLRARGASWGELAQGYGVSRQAVAQRSARLAAARDTRGSG